jgi:hypothetical protein
MLFMKDLGSNYDSFFNDAMTTVLSRVNAVAGAISSDAEGSTLARGQVPQLVDPKIKLPETGVSALADVTSSLNEKIDGRIKLTRRIYLIMNYLKKRVRM